jgi:hypothetical protein
MRYLTADERRSTQMKKNSSPDEQAAYRPELPIGVHLRSSAVENLI